MSGHGRNEASSCSTCVTCERWASFQPYELPVDVPLCATYARHPTQHIMRGTGCMQLAASTLPTPA